MCMETTTLVIIGFRSFLLLRRGDFFSTEVMHMNFSFQLTFLFLDFAVMDTRVMKWSREPKDADFRLRFLGTTVGSTTAIKSAYKTGISIGKRKRVSLVEFIWSDPLPSGLQKKSIALVLNFPGDRCCTMELLVL